MSTLRLHHQVYDIISVETPHEAKRNKSNHGWSNVYCRRVPMSTLRFHHQVCDINCVGTPHEVKRNEPNQGGSNVICRRVPMFTLRLHHQVCDIVSVGTPHEAKRRLSKLIVEEFRCLHSDCIIRSVTSSLWVLLTKLSEISPITDRKSVV